MSGTGKNVVETRRSERVKNGVVAQGTTGAKERGRRVVRKRKQETRSTIFLFIPNLIGYARILLAVVSIYYMEWHPKRSTITYLLSCLLDAFDGFAARKLDQSTSFGAILDMVTDRCTTSCLLCFLSSAYPDETILFQTLISLDLASHYMHMYATIQRSWIKDHRGASHKAVSSETSWILNKYYTNKTVLFIFCAANELFFVGLYLLSFPPRGAPILGTHYGIDLSWPMVIAILTGPICLGKQIINLVQMVRAAQSLADIDILERSKSVKH